MRDLARQGLVKRNQSASSRSVRLVILAGVVVVVLFLLGKLNIAGVASGGDSVVLHDAPRGLTPVQVNGAPVNTDNGVTLSTNNATFRNVSGENATATATRVYGNGSYTLTVTATLPDPKGSKYQVWIVGGDNVYGAGFMDGTKTSWTVTFRDSDKYSSFKNIWITREITTEDEKPEKHILEGSF